jgi:hypothetical protein
VAISYKIEIASASPRNDQLESLNLGFINLLKIEMTDISLSRLGGRGLG